MNFVAFVPTDRSLFQTVLDVIDYPLQSTGTRGQPIYAATPSVLGTIRCLLRQLSDTSSRDIEIARQLVSTATHIVVTGYNTLLTDKLRLRLSKNGVDRIFNIGHVNNCDERNIEMRCTCTEEIAKDQ